MSGGISAGTMAMAAAATVGTVMVMKSMAPEAPKMQAPAKAPPPPQAPKTPDEAARRSSQQTAVPGGMGAGPASTFLSGPGGVAPDSLLLGKNTLLGG